MSEHLTEYIDAQLKDITNLFFVTTDGSGGPVVDSDAQKVRSLLMSVHEAGRVELSKSMHRLQMIKEQLRDS